MTKEEMSELLSAALKPITDRLDKMEQAVQGGDLVPIKLPDGRVGLAKKELLISSLPKRSELKSIEHEDMKKDPWPDPSIPKPAIVR